MAHLTDRVGGYVDRLRDRSTVRRRYDYEGDVDIPV
jgi:hypothetical protein